MSGDTTCTLVTASCTTGWTDWIHGALWACPDGLLRESLGLNATIRHGYGPTIDVQARETRRLGADEVSVIAKGRRNHWIPWGAIARARTRLGPGTEELHLELRDGTRRKFLWLPRDEGRAFLEQFLPTVLGERFISGA